MILLITVISQQIQINKLTKITKKYATKKELASGLSDKLSKEQVDKQIFQANKELGIIDMSVQKQSMIDIYATVPSWNLYNPSNDISKTTKKYWERKELAGGPLTGDLATPDQANIKTPLLQLIKSAETYGFFRITNI